MPALSKRSKAAKAKRPPGSIIFTALPKETSGSEWELESEEDASLSEPDDEDMETRDEIEVESKAEAGYNTTQHRFASFFGMHLDEKTTRKDAKKGTKSQSVCTFSLLGILHTLIFSVEKKEEQNK